MAAMRRVFSFVSRSMKNNFITSLRMDHIGEIPKRKLKSLKPGVAGMYVAAGGAVAYYYYCHVNNSNRGKGLVFNIINNKTDLLPSLPAVAAKEQSRGLDFEDGDVYISSHEQRFRMFSSVEYEGQLYMTPQNFIESVTMDEPKYRRQWKSLSKQELEQILSATPPVWRGTSKLFRNLRDGGIIAYTEYLFLLCILTKPHAGFKIAFKMFDADGNQMVDKKEFLVLQEIFRKKNEKKGRKGDAEKSAQLNLQLYGYQFAPINNVLKDTEEYAPRSYWDILRRSTSQALFSDLAERAEESMMVDTTLLMHFFGKKGKAELNYDDFYRFMDNLQTEVLEIEFLTYSKGMTTISEEDFARILLRYTNVENISSYLDSVRQRISEEKGLTFDEFRSFFQFLNNLEDFAIAMQMYNFANRSIGQDEFKRAVYVATGLKLSQHLVNTVFKIFDVDRDEQLSYKEFIGIMKDRLHRGSRVARQYGVSAFFTCVKAEVRKHCKRLWRR
ncbi:calcium uptake protein 3, mitochondrial-like isoform X1 [Acipenser oxyrinchus oxyrinchus]|uniref:Calcium uptake protein 3, mitochondrial-like isoform X1 n=1 Tax=Acipenser oxyrinchus oxyrinchus TaxID=40147 RepID=A0AAD8LUR0_ACIOX|nr:calcium uptake protein 3, mitochondrial-like isoform X1 [Acipenser oxyrinchus oxyrinchus]